MKMKFRIILATVLALMALAIVAGCGAPKTEAPKTDAPKESSAQATLDTAIPAIQPADHQGRWEELGSKPDGCFECHKPAGEQTVGTNIPLSHYVDKDPSKGLDPKRNSCITCHPAASE